jgi:signal transduction histidine kinase
LEQLKKYKIDDSPITFDSASIKEFSELNNVLTVMTEKIHADYINQKQFIENASHEIQTPLAVIKSKIELLIQSATISESDMQIIQSVYNASNKLSALNKALLLLSKIENYQFKDVEEIQFKTLIEKTLGHFEDIISLKNISIKKNYQSLPSHKMNPILTDILISNLFQNAIRHNINGGSITVQLEERSIIISNTSASSITNTDELFQRFKKNEASAESIGLGLAIVKEICDTNAIQIIYDCKESIHTIKLRF